MIIDRTRSISSGVDKSHGTRLSDQSIDETMRKPIVAKNTSDEIETPESFDVKFIQKDYHEKLFYYFSLCF